VTSFILDRLNSIATSLGKVVAKTPVFLVGNSRRLVVDPEVPINEDIPQEVLVDPAANMEFVDANLLLEPERPVEHPFELAAQDSQEPIEEGDPLPDEGVIRTDQDEYGNQGVQAPVPPMPPPVMQSASPDILLPSIDSGSQGGLPRVVEQGGGYNFQSNRKGYRDFLLILWQYLNQYFNIN
jgi:hypothetical protein